MFIIYRGSIRKGFKMTDFTIYKIKINWRIENSPLNLMSFFVVISRYNKLIIYKLRLHNRKLLGL